MSQAKLAVSGLLFDMDGVLLDSEPVITKAAILGLEEYGVHARPEDFKQFTGMGEIRFIGGVSEQYGVPFRTEMKTRVYEIYQEIVGTEIRLFSGTVEVLRELRARGYRMALASAADHVKIEANLRAARIDRALFDVVLGAEDVERRKPFPDVYELAAARIGLAPGACAVIEDALSGIVAATAAGAPCIAVTGAFSRERLLEAGAAAVIEGIGELAGVLA